MRERAASAPARSFRDDPVVGKIVAFIREGGKRPPMMPALRGGSGRFRRGAMSAADAAAPDQRDRARHHLRRRHPAVRAGRRRRCGAAGVSCCSRCATRPIRSGLRPIRITGSGMGSSAVFRALAEQKAVASGFHRLGGAAFALAISVSTCGALRVMPQLVQTVSRRRRSSAVGRSAGLFEQHGFRLLGAQGNRARACRCRTAPIGVASPSERDRADIARGLALLNAHKSFRHRPGGGRRQQSGAGGGRRRKAPTGCSRASPSCAATGRIRHADGRRRAGQGAEGRSGPSHRSAGRSGRQTVEARRRCRPGRHRGRCRLDASSPSPNASLPRPIAPRSFVVGVSADGTDR